MTPAYTPWLPRSALFDGTLSQRLVDRTDTWAARWLSAPMIASVRMSASAPDMRVSSEATCWEASSSGPFLVIDASGQIEIACAMLGIEPAWSKITAADRDFLSALAAPCLEDFLGSAAEGLISQPIIRKMATKAFPATGGLLRFKVALSAAAPALDLYVQKANAIDARKAMIYSPRPPRALGRREDAIREENVQVGALLGIGKVALSELYSLAAGDVLVLDRACDDPLNLTVNGEARAGARCRLEQDDAALKLRVTAL